MSEAKRYRYVTPIRKGRWLPTRDAAKLAAAKAGCGHVDDQGKVWLDVFTKIESGCPTKPRSAL